VARSPRRRVGSHEIDSARVARIAAISEDRLRNVEITLGYWKLGRQLTNLLGTESTNWCTWATWASYTVGRALDPDARPELVEVRTRRWPAPLRAAAFALVRVSRSWLNPRMAPAIAAGNREIFREIAAHFAAFVEAETSGRLVNRAAAIDWAASLVPAADCSPHALERFARHQRGFVAYHDAVHAPTEAERAEHVLLGNLLMAEYEQARLQPWIEEAFFVRAGPVGPIRRWVSNHLGERIARLTTERVTAIATPEILIPVAAPLAPPPDSPVYRPQGCVAELETCLAELADPSRLPCRSWPDYPARMASIAALFTAYHQEPSLDRAPFAPDAIDRLEELLTPT
jgi:hypothetical protein